MSAYYAQWDAEDLDSWQGKEINGNNPGNDDDNDIDPNKILEAESFVRDHMHDYGLSWRDFL